MGASPIKTIKAISEAESIPIALAKEKFSSSPAWSDVAAQADKLHQEIEDFIDNEA